MSSSRILYWAKKIKYIDYLGGCCKLCNENNISLIDFHHVDLEMKEYAISKNIQHKKYSEIVLELNKCILLCRNCHREVHYIENSKNKLQVIKKQYLNIIGKYSCSCCGYSKCNNALEFHHKYSFDKKFTLSNKKSSIIVSDEVKYELSKCELLCANCHKLKHVDYDFFNSNYLKILNKSRNIIELNNVDYSEVSALFDNGYSLTDIAIMLGRNKSTISTILKKLNKNSSFSFVNIDEVIKLHKHGLSNIEIAKKMNRDKSTIFSIIKKLKLLPNHSINKNTKKKEIDSELLFELLKTKSKTEVSKIMNINRQTIYNIINKNNKYVI